MELCRGNTKPSFTNSCSVITAKKQMLNAILIVHKYSTLVATQASCPHREVPRRAHVQLCLQLFLLEEDLSVHSVRAGGSGVRAGGGGGGLRPRSDQLQLCIRQAVVV